MLELDVGGVVLTLARACGCTSDQVPDDPTQRKRL